MDDMDKRNEIAAELNAPYTMHTATLKMSLTYRSMELIKECMFEELDKNENVTKYFKKKESENKKSYNFLVTDKWGFNYVKIVNCRVRDYHHYWMEIKINPRAMMHSSEYPFVYVASKKDIEASIRRINQFWEEVGLSWVDSRMLYIHRIDYCVNIDVKNEDAAMAYMRLMRKGAYPYKAKRMMEYSETGKRYIETKNSFTVKPSSFEFSIYNKYKQLMDEGEKYPADEIERAKGIIRIELRVYRNKVKNEEAKHGVGGAEEFLKDISLLAKENIPRYLALAYGKGTFVTIQQAKKTIEATSWKKKTKETMKSMLKTVSRQNLQNVREEYGEKFHYYMKKFDQLGISPITVASNCAFIMMQNPLYYIENNSANNIAGS